MQTEKLRELAAAHTGRPAIDESTPIGIASFPNSVRYHRFWASVEDVLQRHLDRKAFATFGDLLAAAGTNGASAPRPAVRNQEQRAPAAAGILAVGIDIQRIDELPRAADYRADPFYSRTFTDAEIGYCLLSEDPRASLAGRFCAKEAIVKADPSYASGAMTDIEIAADANGAPLFSGFALSISHSGGLAVAVAVKTGA